jgi:predicted nucleic acid-binding protein
VLYAKGLEVCELPGTAVSRAALYFNQDRRLQLNDCFALALAEAIDDSILLTGDASLRAVAESKGIEVHGVLWVVDELASRRVVSPRRLYEVLRFFRDDDLVFLPDAEVRRRMTRLRGQF